MGLMDNKEFVKWHIGKLRTPLRQVLIVEKLCPAAELILEVIVAGRGPSERS
jgi:hypothetical protein